MAEPSLAYLADSVILIDHFNGVEAATRFLAAHHREVALSVITRAEAQAGIGDEDLQGLTQVRATLDRFPTLTIDREIADSAAVLRRRHGWKLPDAFQAAVALHHGLRLVTRDAKDFPPDEHDFVTIPYELPG